VIPAGQIQRIRQLITSARSSGDSEALARATHLLDQVLRQNAAEAAGTVPGADPVTRAHARESDPPTEREAAGLRKLRKGRDTCGAARRDGAPCQAPAIPGGLVCRRHGGATPQVVIAAGHELRQLAAWAAGRDLAEARGTPAEFEALCRWSAADRKLSEYEGKLARLAELRAGLHQRRAAVGTVRTS
jgi:hypothetical protein